MADGGNQVTLSNRELQDLPFTEALDKWEPNLAAALPDHIPLERFKRVLITAVNQNADLQTADRRSLFTACAKCAHDGLYPDGREAALVVYQTKVKRRVKGDNNQFLRDRKTGKYIEKEYYVDLVQYLPMIAGIRKRMRNTGEVLSADAEVVFAADQFHRAHGDDPKIVHIPPDDLDADRGEMRGAYAIIKLANGEVLREVMGRHDIEHVMRTFARGYDLPKSPWKTSKGEMWRKTVLRRCSKAAPTGSELDRLFARDDERPHPYPDSPVREIPPRPQREEFRALTNGADQSDVVIVSEDQQEPAFEIVELDGELLACDSAEEAREALFAQIAKTAQRGKPALEGLWESNQGTITAIGEAIEDGAAPLHLAYAEALAAFDKQPAPQQTQPTVEQRQPQQVVAPKQKAVKAADLTQLVVPIRKAAGSRTDWKSTSEDMLARIKGLDDRADTAPEGNFMQANRQTLELMRIGDKQLWATVSYHLGDRDRQLKDLIASREAGSG